MSKRSPTKFSDEARQRIAEAQRRFWAKPENRAARIEQIRAAMKDKAEAGVASEAPASRSPSPETRARLAAASRNYWARKKAVEVPKWVPDSLADEYREIASLFGEESAASQIRRLKREMIGPH
jgi:hypothetical protein